MKRFITCLALAGLLFAGNAFADRVQYVPDIVVTAPGAVWTDSRQYADLDAAIVAIGTTPTTLVITQNIDVDSGPETIHANTTLQFRNGAMIVLDDGETLVINGHVDAGPYQIFDNSDDPTDFDNVTFGITTGLSPNSVAYPEWW